ncbi:O-antigen polymerase [Frigoribacterium faeni]|uniref:O-antigen polymerase n=1 Tax=Frigoribacterium faeni TaxID=145483 RepID=UPI002413830B|nr:O-antigen polymerase [Frigoribacterium faeni]
MSRAPKSPPRSSPTRIGQQIPEAVQPGPLNPLLVSLLGLVLPLILCVASWTQDAASQWPLALVTACISGTRLALLLGRAKPYLYRFAFYLYTYVFLGLAAVVQLSSGSFPSVTPFIVTDDIDRAFGVILTGLVLFEMGQWWASQRIQERLGSDREPLIGTVGASSKRLRPYIVLSLTFSLAFISFVGPQTFLMTRGEVFSSIGETISSTAAASLVRGFAIGCLLVAFAVGSRALRTQEGRKSRGLLFLVISSAILSLFMTNIFNSPRYLAIVVLITLAAGWGLFSSRRKIRLAFAAAIGGLVLIFPILGTLRNSTSFGSVNTQLQDVFRAGDYDSFAQIVNTVTFVRSEGVEGGRQLIGALLVWVPRSFWPDKPESTSKGVAEFMGYSFTNLSSPLWAEFYIDFGFVGVALGFAVLGALMTWLDRRTEAALAFSGAVPASSMIIPFYCVILLRGALLTTIPVLLVVVVCLALLSRRATTSAPRI